MTNRHLSACNISSAWPMNLFSTGADEARDVSSWLEETFCIPPTIDVLQICMLKTQLHTNTVPNIVAATWCSNWPNTIMIMLTLKLITF